jgi:hypothetical protein
MGPAVDDLIKERGDLVKDYDSFQRRYKVLQGKKEQAVGKPSEAEMAGERIILSAPVSHNLTLTAEVAKYEGKVQKGKEAYETANLKCKREIESSHRAHDTLVDTQLLTVLVCQVSYLPLSPFLPPASGKTLRPCWSEIGRDCCPSSEAKGLNSL